MCSIQTMLHVQQSDTVACLDLSFILMQAQGCCKQWLWQLGSQAYYSTKQDSMAPLAWYNREWMFNHMGAS